MNLSDGQQTRQQQRPNCQTGAFHAVHFCAEKKTNIFANEMRMDEYKRSREFIIQELFTKQFSVRDGESILLA